MPAQLPNADELGLIKEYVLLPMALTVFDRDLAIIKGAVKTPGPYEHAIQRAMDAATRELANVRRTLRTSGIKVYEVRHEEINVRANYLCRGYHGTASMLWSYTSVEVQERMKRFLGANISK